VVKRLLGAFRRWRERNREYQIQRALFKEGGGSSPLIGRSARMGPSEATHTPDPWQSPDDA
jgi:hypothetical protein